MTNSRKVAIWIVIAAVVFLVCAFTGTLPVLAALAAIIGRMVVVAGAVALIKRPKGSGTR